MSAQKRKFTDLTNDELDVLLRRLRNPGQCPLKTYREGSVQVRYVEHVPNEELRERLRNGYKALSAREQM